MKKKILLTVVLIAVMTMVLSGCIETYVLYKLLSDDEGTEPTRNIEAARERYSNWKTATEGIWRLA